MEAKEKLLSSTSTFFLEGWVPAEQLSDVEHLLSPVLRRLGGH